MRISVVSGDPGYAVNEHVMARGDVVIVTLDGVPQPGCLTADDEIGMVQRYKTDDHGVLLTKSGELMAEIVYGRVKIELRPYGGRA